jgi:hypothetical protein
MDAPKVAIIYLSYNSRDYIDPVADSIAALNYPDDALEFIIVDNNSTDGSQKYIRENIVTRAGDDLPEVMFFPKDDNPGFAGGNNLAIEHALLEGFDYVYLLNMDAKLHPDAIKEVVDMAESSEDIGSVQSFMKLWKDPDTVNSTGGMTHFLGFGYVRDNGSPVSEVTVEDGAEVSYASGAAVLFKADVLREVGDLEEFYFMYHDDLELGLRIRLAGYKNVFAKKSVAYHDYEFGRSIKKLFWMEKNRWLVLLSHLRWPTLFLLAPFLVGLEIALIPLSIIGGWWKQKLFVYIDFFKPETWKHIFKKRKRSKIIREVTDRELTSIFTGRITHQQTDSALVKYVANPLLTVCWRVLHTLIVW